MALLMGIFRYSPSPFCILDEVDAPLDEPNIQRLTRLLKEMAQQTQFIVITHAKRTMEAAQALYGVTMQEPGVSKLSLSQIQACRGSSASVAAGSGSRRGPGTGHGVADIEVRKLRPPGSALFRRSLCGF